MQSDTFLPGTDSDDEVYSSDSSGDLPKNNNIGVFYKYPNKAIKDERFMDQSLASEYDDVRRSLFSRRVMKSIIYIQSGAYHTASTFNTSDYVATFEEIKSVIGIQLKSANIRVPQYNVNSTNNKVKFKIDGSETIHIVTIRSGYYTATELATAFQETSNTKAQRVDSSTLTVTYYGSNHTSITAGESGMIFKLVHASNIKFLWSNDNVTKGAARLLGFYPVESSSFTTTYHSDKPPDFSQHYVDLFIPEIPSIACKQSTFNDGRKDIIERVPLTEAIGSYQRHEPDNYVTSYFTPITLSQLTIQLFSDNNEEFDSQNTENSFEFEVSILGGA
jgi:hypothetical protein